MNFDNLKDEHETLKMDNQDLQVDYECLKSDYDALKTEHEAGLIGLQMEFDCMKVENDSLKLDFDVSKAEYGDLKLEHAELKREVADLRRENTDLKREVAHLRRENADLKMEVAELKVEGLDLRRENADLRREIVDVKESLEILQEDHALLLCRAAGCQLTVKIVRQILPNVSAWEAASQYNIKLLSESLNMEQGEEFEKLLTSMGVSYNALKGYVKAIMGPGNSPAHPLLYRGANGPEPVTMQILEECGEKVYTTPTMKNFFRKVLEGLHHLAILREEGLFVDTRPPGRVR